MHGTHAQEGPGPPSTPQCLPHLIWDIWGSFVSPLGSNWVIGYRHDLQCFPSTIPHSMSNPICGIVRGAVYACAQYMYVAPIMCSTVSVLSYSNHGATVLPETSENRPQTAHRVSSSPTAVGELSPLFGRS